MRKTAAIILTATVLLGCAKRQLLDSDQAQLMVMEQVVQASLYEQEGNDREAIRAYKRALKLDPKSPLLHLLIAQGYYQLGNDTLAVYYARRAVRLEPDNPDHRLVLGNSYLMAKELKLALEQYRAARAQRPENQQVTMTIAGLFEALGRPDSAAAVLENLADRTGDPEVLLQLGALLMRQRRLDQARQAYQRLSEQDPEESRAWISLAVIEEMQGRPGSALPYYQRAAQSDPQDMGIQRRIFNLLSAAGQTGPAIAQGLAILGREPGNCSLRLQLARLYYHLPDYQNARRQYLLCLESDSLNAEALYDLARINYQAKDYRSSVEYFQKTLSVMPRLSEGWINLGYTFLALGQPDSALQAFGKARRLGVRLDENQLMAAGYALAEKYREALPFYRALQAKKPKDLQLTFDIAVAYERSGDPQSAVPLFRQIIAAQPENHTALNYLGYMFAEQGENLEEAESLIARALKLEPDNAYYLDSMGWVLYRLRRLEEARQQQEKAVALMPGDPTLLEHLGDIYLALGLQQKAREHWEKALEIEPGRDKLKDKVDALP